MTPTLRPMSLGEILDRTVRIYRSKLPVFAGIAALPALAMFGIHLVEGSWLHVSSLVRPIRQPGIFIWRFTVGLGFFHISSLLVQVIYPAHVQAASAAAMEEQCSLRQALSSVALRSRSYLWLSLLKLSAQLILPEILTAGLIFAAGSGLDAIGAFDGDRGMRVALSLFAALVGGGFFLFLWIGACFSLAIPSASLEGIGAIKAIRRSWTLSRQSRMRIAFTWLALAAVAWVLMYGLQFMIRWAVILLYPGHPFRPLDQQIYSVGILLVLAAISALAAPLYPIALTLFYYDQRIRHEGYDIEWMMRAAGLNAPIPPPAGEGQPASAEAPEPLG